MSRSDGSSEPDVNDIRRTHLANERTYLAWIRSALAALAVGIAIARFLPDFQSGPRWPYLVLGLGFCVLGLIMVVLGFLRARQVGRSLERGGFSPLSDSAITLMAAIGLILAFATIAIVLLNR